MGKLTEEQRAKLPDSAFVYPKERKYPVGDASHAVAALAYVAEKGTKEEKAKVRTDVCKRYPGLRYCQQGSSKFEDPLSA
jgi:hypothetical protein